MPLTKLVLRSFGSRLLIAAGVGVLFSPAPASAELVSLVCPGTEQVQYSPGLTNTPRPTNIHAQGVVGPCVGLPLGIVSATYDVIGQGNISCSGGPSQVLFVINWSDGTSSTAVATSAIVQRPVGQVVRIETSTIVLGRFLNATVVRTLTLLQTDLLGCATPQGVTAAAGPVTLSVVGF